MDLNSAIDLEDHQEVISHVESLLVDSATGVSVDHLRRLKFIALIRSESYAAAHGYFTSNPKSFEGDDYSSFLYGYVLYKLDKYSEAMSVIQRLDPKRREIRLLRAQILTKMENYRESFEHYFEMYKEMKVERSSYVSEVYTNLIGSLVLLILTESSKIEVSRDSALSTKIWSIVESVIGENYTSIDLRELCINMLLLFVIVDLKHMFTSTQALTQSIYESRTNMLLFCIENMLPDNIIKGDLGDQLLEKESLADKLTLISLKALIKQKRQQVEWNTSDLESMHRIVSYEGETIKDTHLRISVLTFLCFIESVKETDNEESKGRCIELIDLLDKNLRGLKKNSKISKYLEYVINFNRTVMLLRTGSQAEAKRLFKIMESTTSSEVNHDLLSIEMSLLTTHKNYKDFERTLERLAHQIETPRERCLYHLFKLSFYYNLNNSKDYLESFNDFLFSFFIPQLELPSESRFLSPNVFSQFSKNIVFFILKNKSLVSSLREKLIEIIDYIDNSNIVLQISEGFIKRQEFDVAEKILRKIIRKDPANPRFLNRLNFIYSVVNPEMIEEASLPEFGVSNDLNYIKSLENDFNGYIKKGQVDSNEKVKGKDERETVPQTKRKRTRKERRIRWPKNFNFSNPGPRPDEERWLPKFERKKYRKMALKKGYVSKTQGGTSVNPEQTKELYKAENSTSSKMVSKTKAKRHK